MKVSIGSKFVEGPYGGGNLFVKNLSKYLIKKGVNVVYDLSDIDIDIILTWSLILPLAFASTFTLPFDIEIGEIDINIGVDIDIGIDIISKF